MGVKKNISYNIILTLSGYIIGLITFPYISRVLGPANIGIVSFVDNTINYFILFSTLGATTIGTREIAKYKNDITRISNVFSSLITLYLIFTSIILIVYFFAITFVDRLNIHKELFYIGTAKLLFSVFLIEWLYRGLENFKFIATRTLLIKLIYVISLILFVKNNNDYKLYFLLTTLTVVVNSLVNIIYSGKLVKFTLRGIKLKPYLKQSFFLGSYSVLTSMYTTFNVMYLGFVSDNLQVGYYWAAITLYGVILGFFSSFTSVMMPRMTSLLTSGEKNNFNNMISKSFDILFGISIPLIIVSIFHSPQLINILSGTGFEGAVTPMRIILPLVIVVGVAQILAIQILVPMQKDKTILNASIIGAFVGLLCNIIFVKYLGATGTAIVLLVSELSVTTFYIYSCKKDHILSFPWIKFTKNLIISLPYILICVLSTTIFNKNRIIILLFSIILSLLYFIYSNIFLLKNSTVSYLLVSNLSKFKRNK